MRKMMFEERLRERKDSVGGDFDKALQIFIADRKRMGCTERTIGWYEEVIGRFFREFLVQKSIPIEPEKWISTDIEDYMDYLIQERKCKPITCKTRFSALRAWCNFLYRKGYIQNNPVADLAPMKVKKEVVKTLPDETLDKILKKPNTANCTFADYRDWAIMWTLFDTGIRINELCHIRVADVHLDEGYILITHGKGQKERPVGISKTLSKVLVDYMKVRQPHNEEDFLFCNSYGEQLKTDTFRKRLNDYGKKMGIDGISLSPHKFRYTFAKHYIKNGGDPFRLQKALGHTSMEMVRNYVEMFGADVIDAHQQFSPAENFKLDKEAEKKETRKRRTKIK